MTFDAEPVTVCLILTCIRISCVFCLLVNKWSYGSVQDFCCCIQDSEENIEIGLTMYLKHFTPQTIKKSTFLRILAVLLRRGVAVANDFQLPSSQADVRGRAKSPFPPWPPTSSRRGHLAPIDNLFIGQGSILPESLCGRLQRSPKPP